MDLPGETDAYAASYTYGLRGEMTGLTGKSGVTGSYSYDANGRVTGQSRNGIVTAYSYKPGGMVSEVVSERASDGAQLLHVTYGHERSGNVVTESATGETGLSSKQYAYDGKNRMLAEDIYAGSGVEQSQEMTYDARENVLTRQVESNRPGEALRSESNSYAGNNKLVGQTVSVGADGTEQREAAYDAAGNMTESLDGAALSYDLFGRLVSYTKDGKTVTYTYDGDGVRLSKTVEGEKTAFVWDGMDLVAEVSGAGDVTGYYYGPTGVEYGERSGAVMVYVKNGLGDVVSTYDVGAGELREKRSFDAWGNPIDEYGGAVAETAQSMPVSAAAAAPAEPSASPAPEPAGMLAASMAAEIVVAEDTSEDVVYLSDMEWRSELSGWGPVERDEANGSTGAGDGGAMRIGNKRYEKGIGCHAVSQIDIDLGGGFARFESEIGIDENSMTGGSVIFRVYGDGLLLYESEVLRGTDNEAVAVSVDVSGVELLRLEVDDAGDGKNSDSGDWADAKVVRHADPAEPDPGPVPGADTWETPFGYRGEYTDAETGYVYLRARYYDPEMGRFISEDTHWNPDNMIYGDNPGDHPVPNISAIMQSGNLYVYGMNNPNKYLDYTGLVAGELFESADEAAKDFVWNNNPKTHDDNRERGTYIYEVEIDGKTYYTYFDTMDVGGHSNVVLNAINDYGVAVFAKFDWLNSKFYVGTPTAFVHTHPSCTCHVGEEFSDQDKWLTNLPGISTVYLGTPNGMLYSYDGSNDSTYLVSSSMPKASVKYPDSNWR